MHVYLAVTKAERTLQKTNLIIITSLLDTHSASTIYLCLTEEEERTERERKYFQHRQLANTGKKHKRGYDRVPWSFVFLRMPLPSFWVQSKFWFQWKAWHFGDISPLHLFSCGHNTPCTYLLCFTELQHSVGLWVFCACGALRMFYVNRAARNSGCAYCFSCSRTCSIVPSIAL